MTDPQPTHSVLDRGRALLRLAEADWWDARVGPGRHMFQHYPNIMAALREAHERIEALEKQRPTELEDAYREGFVTAYRKDHRLIPEKVILRIARLAWIPSETRVSLDQPERAKEDAP